MPWFTKESVDKEQGIIGQEIRMIEDDPENQVFYGMLEALYEHNPVRVSIAGTVESIAEITAETLYACLLYTSIAASRMKRFCMMPSFSALSSATRLMPR